MNLSDKYRVTEVLGFRIYDAKTGQLIEDHSYTEEEKAFFDSKMGIHEYEDFCKKQSNILEENEQNPT